VLRAVVASPSLPRTLARARVKPGRGKSHDFIGIFEIKKTIFASEIAKPERELFILKEHL